MRIQKVFALLLILILCLGTFSADGAGSRMRRKCLCKTKKHLPVMDRKIVGQHKKCLCQPYKERKLSHHVFVPGPLPLV
ncbi:hypothetical protein L345_05179 [Ophiophagus hannah]|uniref:Uncharacterized protein n=1 Tax=Ophiophagus hannah TaxID=8665 RepID=V8P3Y2_OPHHA|nr:hypothetical protein L345_05179 [Ophiophagus hannah]